MINNQSNCILFYQYKKLGNYSVGLTNDLQNRTYTAVPKQFGKSDLTGTTTVVVLLLTSCFPLVLCLASSCLHHNDTGLGYRALSSDSLTLFQKNLQTFQDVIGKCMHAHLFSNHHGVNVKCICVYRKSEQKAKYKNATIYHSAVWT